MNHLKSLTILILISVLLLGACAPQAPQEVALKATGNIAAEKGWSLDQLKALGTMEADYTDKEGVTETFTGVSIAKLLEAAGANEGATAVVFVADDGFTSEVTMEEVKACADCIVAFNDDGTLRVVMPGFSGKQQVKGVIEIQVK